MQYPQRVAQNHKSLILLPWSVKPLYYPIHSPNPYRQARQHQPLHPYVIVYVKTKPNLNSKIFYVLGWQ